MNLFMSCPFHTDFFILKQDVVMPFYFIACTLYFAVRPV